MTKWWPCMVAAFVLCGGCDKGDDDKPTIHIHDSIGIGPHAVNLRGVEDTSIVKWSCNSQCKEIRFEDDAKVSTTLLVPDTCKKSENINICVKSGALNIDTCRSVHVEVQPTPIPSASSSPYVPVTLQVPQPVPGPDDAGPNDAGPNDAGKQQSVKTSTSKTKPQYSQKGANCVSGPDCATKKK